MNGLCTCLSYREYPIKLALVKTLMRNLIPEDYVYYRSGSKVFFEYLSQFRSYIVKQVTKKWEFFSAVQILPGFWSVNLEKVDFELSKSYLSQYGIHHGIICWTPLRTIDKPKWWLRVPRWYAKYELHSSRSAFSILDRSDYWMKWSPKARAHRRKVEEYIASGKIIIRKDYSLSDFLDLYAKTPVQDGDKRFRIRLTKKLFEKTKTNYRIYIIEVDGVPLAGEYLSTMHPWVNTGYRGIVERGIHIISGLRWWTYGIVNHTSAASPIAISIICVTNISHYPMLDIRNSRRE